MERLTIDAFARMLAEQLCEERWGSAGAHNGLRSIAVDDLVIQIQDHIGSLARLGAIRPRHPDTGAAAGDPVPDSYILTRTDADQVTDFVQSDDQSKRDFPEKFAKQKAAGRYTLNQAAAIIETETGEPYEEILERLQEAASNGALPTYEPGWSQPIKYGAARPVREKDEAHGFDLNSRLAHMGSKFRFPSPTGRRRDVLDVAIDKAIERAGNQGLNSVWLQLKDLALKEEPPFTGHCKNSELIYTTSQNKIDCLSKKALGQRLIRRGGDTRRSK